MVRHRVAPSARRWLTLLALVASNALLLSHSVGSAAAAGATDVCTTPASPGDANVGIAVVTDAACKNGGLGCFANVCRFCKTRSTEQSKHLLSCTQFSSLVTSAPVVIPPLTSPPTLPPPSGQRCTVTVSPGDAQVGINIVTDEACRGGGLGCLQDVCRFCKVRDTIQSKHLMRCDQIAPPVVVTSRPTSSPAPVTQAPVSTTSAPVATTQAPVPATPAPVPTTLAPVPVTVVPATLAPVPTTLAPAPTSLPGRCSSVFSAEAAALGATAFLDPTCRGSISPDCTNIVCRMCKAVDIPQLSYLKLCSTFANAPRPPPAPASPTPAPVSGTPVTPPPTTLAPTVLPTPAPLTETSAPQTTAPSTLAPVVIEPEVILTLAPTPAPTPFVDPCKAKIPRSAASVGLFAFTDPTCESSPEFDCVYSVCRTCKFTNHQALATLRFCTSFPNAPAPFGSGATVAPTPIPTPSAPINCSSIIPEGGAAYGIQAFADPMCKGVASPDCSGGVCRLCKTVAREELDMLSFCSLFPNAPSFTPVASPSATPSPVVPDTPTPTSVAVEPETPTPTSVVVEPETPTPSNAEPATPPTITERCIAAIPSEAAVLGLSAFADVSCQSVQDFDCVFGVCRLCKTSSHPQLAAYRVCSGVSDASTPAPAPASTDSPTPTPTSTDLSTPAPVSTASATPAPTPAPPKCDDSRLAIIASLAGLKIFSDPTCDTTSPDCVLSACRLCKNEDRPDLAEFSFCAAASIAPPTVHPEPETCPSILPREVTELVGVFVFTDVSCKSSSSFDCVNKLCRVCKVKDVAQLRSLAWCDSFPNAPALNFGGTPAPVDEPVEAEPPVETQPPVEEPATTQPPVEVPITTQPPVEEPIATQPPVDEPVTTQPPVITVDGTVVTGPFFIIDGVLMLDTPVGAITITEPSISTADALVTMPVLVDTPDGPKSVYFPVPADKIALLPPQWQPSTEAPVDSTTLPDTSVPPPTDNNGAGSDDSSTTVVVINTPTGPITVEIPVALEPVTDAPTTTAPETEQPPMTNVTVTMTPNDGDGTTTTGGTGGDDWTGAGGDDATGAGGNDTNTTGGDDTTGTGTGTGGDDTTATGGDDEAPVDVTPTDDDGTTTTGGTGGDDTTGSGGDGTTTVVWS